jgi:hypothetical protein
MTNLHSEVEKLMADAPFISIDLGNRGGKLTFQTFDDLRIWSEKECSQWNWVGNAGFDSNIGYVLRDGQIYFRDSLRGLIGQYPSNNGLFAQIRSIFADLLKNGRALISTSAPGKFVLKLHETNPVGALWALATLTGVSSVMSISQVPLAGLDGFIQAMMFRHGLKGSASSEREALEGLYGEMATALSAKIAGLEGAKGGFDQLVAEFNAAKDSFQSNGEAAIDEAKRLFAGELETTKDRFAAIEKTYEDKLALQAPVKYWTDKAVSHARKFRSLAWSSGIAMMLAIVLVTTEVSCFVPKVTKGEFPDPWRIGMVLITVTMLIWIIRLLVKMTLSQLHLQTDAEERTVLANAYLALLQRDQALRPEDREMVLQVLFRSAATGIVDDGGPATPIEIITKAVSGQRQ